MRALRQYSFCVRPLERQRSMWANILFRLRCRLVMIERLARSSDGYFRWTIWYWSDAYKESEVSVDTRELYAQHRSIHEG